MTNGILSWGIWYKNSQNKRLIKFYWTFVSQFLRRIVLLYTLFPLSYLADEVRLELEPTRPEPESKFEVYELLTDQNWNRSSTKTQCPSLCKGHGRLVLRWTRVTVWKRKNHSLKNSRVTTCIRWETQFESRSRCWMFSEVATNRGSLSPPLRRLLTSLHFPFGTDQVQQVSK